MLRKTATYLSEPLIERMAPRKARRSR